jgi:3-oxoacyl-[acyl-carrier-protein] synthase II
MAGISALGETLDEHFDSLRLNKSGVSYITDWDRYSGLKTRLAAEIKHFELPSYYDRKKTRFMGRVAKLAVRTTEIALQDAGLLADPILKNGRLGIAYGSATGSPEGISRFGPLWFDKKMKEVSASSYLQMMPHTCAANIAVHWGINGRVIPTCSACTSGSQGIGYAYETILTGKQDIMIAGGAEELCVTIAAVFDSMGAASTRNDQPYAASRPFSVDRDGVVIGEGAATLILEELNHAKARNARIAAELIGFGTNVDGSHLLAPHADAMENCMKLALKDANLTSKEIRYVNAHATATELGDVAEATATAKVFGQDIHISSLKGHFGHTLGACGALEAWLTIEMLRGGWFAPTLNLKDIDPACADLNYIRGEGIELNAEHVMCNNFAFGGTNTSLIFKKYQE